MRVVFAGTPDFARVALAALHASGFEIPLVLTQPDRPAGRGLKLVPSPVKALALAHGVPVAQPSGLRLDGRFAADAAAAQAALTAARPDVMLVAAYGLLLPRWVLELPRHGCLNIHASLLPRWRGAAPVQRAIEAGDSLTGVTLMQMDEGLDTGAMLAVRSTAIVPTDTAATLLERLAGLGAELAVDGLRALEEGPLAGQPQPDEGVTHAAKIAKAEAIIDWREPATVIERRLRAFDPFPGARSQVEGEVITCWRGEVRSGSGRPGEVLAVDGGALTVACGRDSLALTELQRAGGRRLPAAAFLHGRSPHVGAVFAGRDAACRPGI